jgi:hypothetical protein
MNRIFGNILLIVIFVLCGAVGCAKKTVPVKSTDKIAVDYSDDLSKYRIEQDAPKAPNYNEGQEVLKNEALLTEEDISAELNVILDSIAAKNMALGYLPGYTILVYSGTSRTEADRIRNKLFSIMGAQNVPPLQYILPTYFVKIGRFHEQIEAQPLYLDIRSYYPNATIVPEKFEVEDEPKEDN